MPIYEYRCDACHRTFEKLLFKGDKESIECPECHSSRVIKIMSAGSFMEGARVSGNCGPGSSGGFS